VCFFFPDNEARGYDEDGKVLDIGYNAGVTAVNLDDWKKFFELLAQGGPRAEFFKSRVSEDDWKTITGAAAGYGPLADAERAARDAHKPPSDAYFAMITKIRGLEKEPNKTNELAAAQKELTTLASTARALESRVNEASDAVKSHLAATRRIVEALIAKWIDDPNFTFTDRRDLERVYKAADRAAREAFDQGRDLLISNGLTKSGKGFDFSFTPVRAKPGPLEERLTPFEHSLVERLNAAAISLLLLRGCATSSFTENYVDGAIGAKKDWRDVYHYDASRNISGWTRYTPGGEPAEFNAAGELVEKGKASPVRYEPKPDLNNRYRMRLVWSAQK
jgi:hypothetical protein